LIRRRAGLAALVVPPQRGNDQHVLLLTAFQFPLDRVSGADANPYFGRNPSRPHALGRSLGPFRYLATVVLAYVLWRQLRPRTPHDRQPAALGASTLLAVVVILPCGNASFLTAIVALFGCSQELMRVVDHDPASLFIARGMPPAPRMWEKRFDSLPLGSSSGVTPHVAGRTGSGRRSPLGRPKNTRPTGGDLTTPVVPTDA
jgi:hypothetical protein